MKRKKFLLISVLGILTIIGVYSTMNKKDVTAEENLNHKTMVSSEEKDDVTMNLTIRKAIERAKIDPEFWNTQNEQEDSDTVLAVGGGFLTGEMTDSQDGVSYNSDTDPNATTLGEIRAAVASYIN